jgi:hypothetical protein
VSDTGALIETTRASVTAAIMLFLGESREKEAERLADLALGRYLELWSVLHAPLSARGMTDREMAELVAPVWRVVLRMLLDSLASRKAAEKS